MAIKKFTANVDNTIVNTFETNMSTRATGSNSGQADIVEVYSIWARQQISSSATSGSQELSRVLMKFPISDISSSRVSNIIPASGRVNFYLRVFEAEHSRTIPKNFELVVQAISRSWEEGDGMDLTTYKDLTKNEEGSNWMRASKAAAWSSVGGDYHANPTFVQYFTGGIGDVEINITELVEEWIHGNKSNYGLGIRLSSSYEAYYSGSTGADVDGIVHNPDGAKKSYYTKRFFARGSQYYFKRPVLEARWDSVTRDDRADFHYSSSLATDDDNFNTIFLYNYVRGRLRDIPAIGTSDIYVSIYTGSVTSSLPSSKSERVLLEGSADGGAVTHTSATGSHVSTGIYKCEICLTNSYDDRHTYYDVWHSADNASTYVEYFTGSIKPKVLDASMGSRDPVYFINITNLRNSYMNNQNARFNVYIREKNWSPTVYSKASQEVETLTIRSASYRVIRTRDGIEAVPHETSSVLSTGLSYDASGNYFNFDMKLLQPGYEYGFKFAFYDDELGSWQEQDRLFKFRVNKNEH